jgi:hypothetical protein
LATTFTEMEIQSGFLSEAETETGGVNPKCERNGGHRRSIGALLEIIREDLNNYNECMIPVDEANTLNMKLFPSYPPPPPIKAWHVPLATIPLTEYLDDRWDLTLRKVVPQIDGIADVRRIAHTADVSLELTKLALQHLLYYKTILIADMFFWSNVYICTPLLSDLVRNTDGLLEECAQYVFNSDSSSTPRGRMKESYGYALTRMFVTFGHGRTVKDWLKIHMEEGTSQLIGCDVRRLVQFGVIKGLLRRVHKFAVSSAYLRGIVSGEWKEEDSAAREDNEDVRTVVGDDDDEEEEHEREQIEALRKKLVGYVDGKHHFDQIITECNACEKQIIKALRELPVGDVQVLYR